MRVGIIFSAILMIAGGCKTNQTINPDKVEGIEQDCDRLRLKKFKKLNGCEKISYLHNAKMNRFRMSNDAFVDLLFIIGKETGIAPSIVFNIGGGVYPSDTLFDYDMKRWTTQLGCDSIIQIKRLH